LQDHWREWKGMAHDDPAYNALDVVATWRIFRELSKRMTDADLWHVYMREARHVGVLAMAMEARGLAVCPTAQRKAVVDNGETCNRIKDEVTRHVAEIFAKRRVPHERRLSEVAVELEGITLPRLKKDRDPVVDARVTALRKERDRCHVVIARWTQGFDLGNNDHLRWLLYDKDGFKLPSQKKDGRVTADTDAIARLLALKQVQGNDVIKSVLAGVKEYQHAMKMTNTFLLWNVKTYAPSNAIDAQGVAHPEYRPFGTGTGRMAGGPDSDLGDRQVNPYAYNALNIPEETRAIYVPHSRSFTVNANSITTEIDYDNDEESEAGDM